MKIFRLSLHAIGCLDIRVSVKGDGQRREWWRDRKCQSGITYFKKHACYVNKKPSTSLISVQMFETHPLHPSFSPFSPFPPHCIQQLPHFLETSNNNVKKFKQIYQRATLKAAGNSLTAKSSERKASQCAIRLHLSSVQSKAPICCKTTGRRVIRPQTSVTAFKIYFDLVNPPEWSELTATNLSHPPPSAKPTPPFQFHSLFSPDLHLTQTLYYWSQGCTCQSGTFDQVTVPFVKNALFHPYQSRQYNHHSLFIVELVLLKKFRELWK